MKNKLLLSLLCATAISSTGFAATPALTLEELTKRLFKLEEEVASAIPAVANRIALEKGAARKGSPLMQALAGDTGLKGLRAQNEPITGLPYAPGKPGYVMVGGNSVKLSEVSQHSTGDILYNGQRFSRDGATLYAKNMFGALRLRADGKTVKLADGNRIDTTGFILADSGIATNAVGDTINTNNGTFTAAPRPATKPKVDQDKAASTIQKRVRGISARSMVENALKDLVARRNTLDSERSQLETQLLDLDNQFKANSPAYEAAKKRLAEVKQRLDAEDSRLDQEEKTLAAEKTRVDTYEADYNQQVADAEAMLASSRLADKKAVTAAINSLRPKSDGSPYDVVTDKDAIVAALVKNIIEGEAGLESYAKYRADEVALQSARTGRKALFDEFTAAEQTMDPFKQSKSDYESARKPLEERLAQIPDELKPFDDGISKIGAIKSAKQSRLDNLKKPAPGGAGSAAASGGANNPPPPPPPPAPKKPEISVPNLAGGVSVVADDLSSAPNTPVNNSSSSPVAVSGTGGQGGSGGDGLDAPAAATKTAAITLKDRLNSYGGKVSTAANAAFTEANGDYAKALKNLEQVALKFGK